MVQCAPRLLDRVLELDPGADGRPARIVASRAVPADEPFFAGHFPDMPVVPGVFSLEAMAEAARRLRAAADPAEGGVWRLARAASVRFRRPVTPGSVLEFEVVAAGPPRRFAGVARVDGKTVAEAEFDLRRV